MCKQASCRQAEGIVEYTMIRFAILCLLFSSSLNAGDCPCGSHANQEEKDCCKKTCECDEQKQNQNEPDCKCFHFESDTDKRDVTNDLYNTPVLQQLFTSVSFESKKPLANEIFIPERVIYNLLL